MPRRVASACRRRRPGGVPWPPRARASPVFKPQQLRFSQDSPFFLSHAVSLPCPAPSSARAALATVAPPAKLATGGPPSPTITRTSLRLALRHPVLAAGSPFEQGKATLSGFTAVGLGAAALDLAVERASPFLLYPLESPSRVRHLLADPVRAPSCPVMAGNGRRPAGSCRAAMAPGTPAWRGRLPSALCWARAPSRAVAPFPPLGYSGRKRPWASCSRGPAQ